MFHSLLWRCLHVTGCKFVFLRNHDIQMAPDKTVPLPRTAVSETNIELSTQLNGWTLGRVCWVHVSDPIWADCLLTLTSCSMLLPAIREGENSAELLEKTLLKLRQDQKGSLLKSKWLRFYTIPIPVISDSNTEVSFFLSSVFFDPLRVTSALLCGVEHQRQELPECPGCPTGAPHTPAPRRAAAVPGSPITPWGPHSIHRLAGGTSALTNRDQNCIRQKFIYSKWPQIGLNFRNTQKHTNKCLIYRIQH